MSSIQHILVCTDFSPTSEFAIDQAHQLASALDVKLTLLHVSSPLAEVQFAEMLGDLKVGRDERIEIGKEIHAAMQRLSDAKLGSLKDIEVKVISADNAIEAINGYAQQNAVDLIVMGSHGRTGLSHLLMGSVAEKVARHAHCSVQIARPED